LFHLFLSQPELVLSHIGPTFVEVLARNIAPGLFPLADIDLEFDKHYWQMRSNGVW
jgi:hypothetical protein